MIVFWVFCFLNTDLVFNGVLLQLFFVCFIFLLFFQETTLFWKHSNCLVSVSKSVQQCLNFFWGGGGRDLPGSSPDIAVCPLNHPSVCWTLSLFVKSASCSDKILFGICHGVRLIWEVGGKKYRHCISLCVGGAFFLPVRHCMKRFRMFYDE